MRRRTLLAALACTLCTFFVLFAAAGGGHGVRSSRSLRPTDGNGVWGTRGAGVGAEWLG